MICFLDGYIPHVSSTAGISGGFTSPASPARAFRLSDDDMEEIARLNIGHSEIVDHSDPAFIRMISGLKIHS